MSARELVTGDAPCTVNQEGDRGPIPQQLKEVIELVDSTNQKIEDCAVEWQAKISQAQWRILDSKPVDNKPWEQSVLARTYFADKTLDDAFQGLLKHNKTFNDHLQNFVGKLKRNLETLCLMIVGLIIVLALIRGDQPTMIIRQTCNAQNQCSELRLGDEEQLLARGSLDLSVLEKNQDTTSRKIDSDSILTKAQESFTDLIKAKIDFDTKFLGFEATLNGNGCGTSDPSLGLCQICSTVLGCGTVGMIVIFSNFESCKQIIKKIVNCTQQGKVCKTTRNHRNVQLYKKKIRRSSRIKHKRLASKKIALKNKEKKEADNESAPDNSYLSNQPVITAGRV